MIVNFSDDPSALLRKGFRPGKNNLMLHKSRKRFLNSCSNPTSKFQNRKLVGLVAIILAFAMCGVAAHAQQSKKIFRIGYLAGADRATNSSRSEPFRLALRDLGYIEGQNIEIEYRF